MGTKVKTIEAVKGQPIALIIQEAYNRLGSVEAVGAELGLNPSTISYWIMKTGLVFRTVLVDPDQESYSITDKGKNALAKVKANSN